MSDLIERRPSYPGAISAELSNFPISSAGVWILLLQRLLGLGSRTLWYLLYPDSFHVLFYSYTENQIMWWILFCKGIATLRLMSNIFLTCEYKVSPNHRVAATRWLRAKKSRWSILRLRFFIIPSESSSYFPLLSGFYSMVEDVLLEDEKWHSHIDLSCCSALTVNHHSNWFSVYPMNEFFCQSPLDILL